MRSLLVALAAAGLGACAPARSDCDLTHTREVTFSRSDARDSISAQASGPSCDKAVGHYIVRDAEGFPLWAWSAPMSLAFGPAAAPGDPEHMRAFLELWAQPEMSTTQSAPAWEQLAPLQTTLDQLTYEDIRARNLPMLCHLSGTARHTCVFWEPAAGGAGLLYERQAEEIDL